MSAARDDMTNCYPGSEWQQLLSLESRHREIQLQHESLTRRLDEAAMSSDRLDLMVAWSQYRAVVADLSRVAEEIGSLKPEL